MGFITLELFISVINGQLHLNTNYFLSFYHVSKHKYIKVFVQYNLLKTVYGQGVVIWKKSFKTVFYHLI